MLLERTLHFDTVYSNKTNNNSYNVNFVLPEPIRKVSKIYLQSIEFPIGFANIRSSSTLNKFSISISGTVYNITLTDKVYTSISSLCADIVTASTSVLPAGDMLSFVVNTNGTITCTITNTTAIAFTINPTQLSNYVLGFLFQNSPVISSTQYSITGQNNYLLNVDNYINLYLDVRSNANSNANNQLCSFKVPLNANSGVVYYLAENSTFAQYVTLSDPTYILNQFNIIVFDRFGNIINSLGLDYSFSLKIVYED